ncbi:MULTISPECIES: hypothetical protein [unclassified Bartonella]|uniref:hypothetical protein n=1 Tax=unclassified Bartonella TaxID=2645622 RepID=UPI0035CF0BD0
MAKPSVCALQKPINQDKTLPLRYRYFLRHRPKIFATTSNLEKSPTLLARGIQAKK